jgi:class 3 adenylate cyclase/tetratricopeptide (TPR) repeat protein
MVRCPNCGEENPERARFCLNCGTALAAEPPEPSAEERKVVSVLFVDLVGFTARSEAADPEDVRATLRPYHAMLKREIERFGGTVEKFIGDAVMAVFGAPVAHEDDAERAVRAALRIVEAIPELNEDHAGLDLAVRAAVNTGEAVVTLGARPERGEGFVAGDVVNTASRLQGAAPVGGVVVGEVTRRATGDVIRYEELEPVGVKGKAEPVPLWRAIEARSRFGVDVERPRTPFVGHAEDLTLLRQTFLRSVREPGVQLVTVTGEPGVGKTRLVAEFQAWVDDLPELVFWRQGRCLPYGDGITFWALGEVVKAHAGILESDGPEQAARKLADVVDAVVDEPDREWTRTRLAPLVGLAEAATEGTDRRESFTAWRTFLESIAARSPLVVVLEDLHWADEAMLEFVDELVDWSTGIPLTVVCTARPELFERHAGWGGGKRNSATLSLAPLSGEDTARLISALLDQAVLPAETQTLLLERAGGNPLYAEEFIRMLVDRGVLEHRGQAWTVAEGEVPVPETVQATIAARLDTLSPDRKAMLQDASVVGKVFWSGAVAAMGGRDDREVREGLHELSRKELIRPARRSSVEGQAEYAFWHALVRDVTYGQLPRPTRVRKHRAAAAWLEELAGDRIADHAELLVHHYREALELARATGSEDDRPELEASLRRFLLLAAERTQGLDLATAQSHAEQAVELTPLAERGPVLTLLAQVLQRRGNHPEAAAAAEEAIRLFEAKGDEAGALDARLILPTIVRQLGDTERAAILYRELISILERSPPGPALAKAYTLWSGNSMLAGESARSLEYAEKAIELSERFGLVSERARALQFRGASRSELGDPAGALADLEEALGMSLELSLPEASSAYVNLADWLWESEGPARALEGYTNAIDFAERRGLLSAATWALGQTTWALFDLGEWDRLLATAAEVIRRDGGTSQASALPVPFRLRVLAWRGRLEEAAAEVPDLLERARHIRDPQILLPALTAASFVEDEMGNTDAALELLAEFEGAAATAPPWWTSFVFEALRTLVRAGRLDRAQALADHVRPFGTRSAAVEVSFRAALAEGRGEIDEALRLHEEAAARWDSFGFVLELGHALLGAGRCRVAQGARDEAVEPLHRARALLGGLGVGRLVDEADRLLAEATALSS